MQSELFSLCTEHRALHTTHWVTQVSARECECEPAAPAGTPAHSRLGLAPQGPGERAEAELQYSARPSGRSSASDSGDRSPQRAPAQLRLFGSCHARDRDRGDDDLAGGDDGHHLRADHVPAPEIAPRRPLKPPADLALLGQESQISGIRTFTHEPRRTGAEEDSEHERNFE